MEIKKSSKLNNVRYDIRGPVTDLAYQMEQEGTPVVKLNTGNPAAFGFKPPDYSSILENELQLTAAYSSSKGLTEAREAIAAYESSKGIPNIKIDNVFTGNGVSELISISLNALLNDNDEILIPTPDYPLWTAAARLAGGKVVHYLCDESASWFPDMDDIKRKITPRTKAIVVISPNNPTGAVYPKEILEGICNLARQHNLLIFSDEIYDRMLMDDAKHIAISSLAPDLPVITMNGLSKSHQLCGFRCGWMVISGDLSNAGNYIEGINVLASMRLCANVNAQAIIPAALKDPHFVRNSLLPGGRLYEQREQAYVGLNSIPGISVVKSSAGLYLFPKLDNEQLNIHDDEKFVLDFLREKHVLLTHGGSYNWDKPDHFRLVYLPEKEVLADVIERLRDFLSNYRQS
ncbi:MAG: pyridoxal phosphate-dependent aminotransferase [Defluviitaleaceae bacterium]|nr:pyridoxal phosphate-dependent aminotransferase [Defluviitaleaceae bacterium]